MRLGKDGGDLYNVNFDKSQQVYGIFADNNDSLPEDRDEDDDHDQEKFEKSYEMIDFTTLKGSITQKNIFTPQDATKNTNVMQKEFNIDRLPKAKLNLKDDNYGI